MGHGMGFPADGLENHGWKLYITSLVMIIAAGLFVAARVISRLRTSQFGSDDAAVLVSLAFSIVVSVAMQLAISSGYGMHKKDLSKEELNTALRLFFIAQTPYKVTVCLNKVAAILLYLRIFITRKFRICAYVAMGIVVAWSIGAVGATIWQCVPIAASWDKSVDGKCIDKDSFWIAYAVMNICTDIMVLALPIPSILKLQLGRRDRLLLLCVFLLGGFVTVTSILRTTSVQNSLKKNNDITWNFIDRGIWTLIEANLGLISGCLIVLRRPLGHLFPRWFGGSSVQHRRYRDGGNYDLSDMSAQPSHPAHWRESGKGECLASVSGPESKVRSSDEQHIITTEVEGPGENGKENRGGIGIRKQVDVTWSESSSL